MKSILGISAVAVVLLAGCGGGGGGATSTAIDARTVDSPTGAAGACPNVAYTRPDTGNAAPFPSGTVWVTDDMTKVRPQDALGTTQLTQIAAARNESEMFQVVVHNNGGALQVTDVYFSLPNMPTGGLSDLERVMIYRAGYMNVTTPTNSEGAVGQWPDALIPEIDNFACETRNAFPADIDPGRNQSFYVDVTVPRYTPPGVYSGTLIVKGVENPGTPSARTVTETREVDVKVWDFTIPSSSSLQSNFGFIPGSVAQGHQAVFTKDELQALDYRYALAGLRDRIVVDGASIPPYTYQNGTVTIDWTDADKMLAPFLDGTATPNGAKWSAVDGRPYWPSLYQSAGQAGLTAFYKAYVDHFKQRGWLDRLWVYTLDEPTSSQFAEVKDRAQAALAADPAMRPLVTKSLVSGLADTPTTSPIRIWVPHVTLMNDALRAQFQPYIDAGATLWFYQACDTHGCTGQDITGYPSYMIDIPGAYNRIMPWLAFRYHIAGELYYDTMESYFRLPDPWQSQFIFHGNGEGTLFYPGRPAVIGGRTHIPVESLRLKLIREGYEDYEYLHLMATQDSSFASQELALVARTPHDFAHSPGPFYAARNALGERLSALVQSGAMHDNESGQ